MLKKRGFYKGINLGGWLSQCNYEKEHLDTFITEKDFEKIATWGFDHVRIPVDYNIFEDKNGNFTEENFFRIDNALDFCERYNLNTVIDLHKTVGFSFDIYEKENGFFSDEVYQEKFYILWERIAKRYGKFSDRVAFELLNEVTDEKYIDAWNRISVTCISRLRKYAPDTLILCGSHHNNSAAALSDLVKPYDENVIYNFHCYEPLIFTHQGATWTDKINPENRMTYAESGCNAGYFENEFAPALEAANKNNTILYCGEYGVIDIVPPHEAIKWFKDINEIFEKYQIGRCMWNYKEKDFGISDKRFDSYREELLKYI